MVCFHHVGRDIFFVVSHRCLSHCGSPAMEMGGEGNSKGISEPSTRPPAALLVITLLHFQLQRSRMVLSQAKGLTRQEHEFMQDIAKKRLRGRSAGITPTLSGKNRDDTRPPSFQYSPPTSRGWNWRMTEFNCSLPMRVERALPYFKRAPSWRADLHIVALNDEELHALLLPPK